MARIPKEIRVWGGGVGNYIRNAGIGMANNYNQLTIMGSTDSPEPAPNVTFVRCRPAWIYKLLPKSNKLR
jgi:hypothetical protein